MDKNLDRQKAILAIINDQIIPSPGDSPLRHAPEYAAKLINELVENESILVYVDSGIATSDDPRVKIIDHDILE